VRNAENTRGTGRELPFASVSGILYGRKELLGMEVVCMMDGFQVFSAY
jgi:hypothetical protein